MDLITLSEVKEFLEITNTNHDSLLTTIISGVSPLIESFLNRNLEKTARTAYFNAGRGIITLPAYPIDLGSAFTLTDTSSVLTKDSDFFLRAEEGIVEFYPLCIPTYYQPNQICITWTGGYVNSNSLPGDMKLAVNIQCAFMFRGRNRIGANSVTLPDGSMSYNAPITLLKEVKDMLYRHRRKPAMI